MKVIINTTEERTMYVKRENPSALAVTIVTDSANWDLEAYLADVDFKITAKQKGITKVVFNGKMLEFLAVTRAPYGFTKANTVNTSTNGGETTVTFMLPLLTVFNLDGNDELVIETRNYRFEATYFNNITLETIEGQGVQTYIPYIHKQLLQFAGQQTVSFPQNVKNVILSTKNWLGRVSFADLINGTVELRSDAYNADLLVEYIESKINDIDYSLAGAEKSGIPMYQGVETNGLRLEGDFTTDCAFYSHHMYFDSNITNAANMLARRISNK